MTSIGLVIACYLGLASMVDAQDTHYWMQQFGTRSSMMGGAVVAGPADNSTIIYNPGGLGFITDPTISVTASVYRIENVRIENALGQMADFRSINFRTTPSLVAGMLPTGSEKWKIGYGAITPVDFRFRSNARLDGYFPIADDNESPGDELFVGEVNKIARLSEFTAALGIGYKINDGLSIGLTNMFTIRSSDYNHLLLTHMILNDVNMTEVQTSVFQQVHYFHVRYTARFGVAYKKDRWSMGMTITTPSIGILGRGSVAADLNIENLLLEGKGRVSGFASDRQAKLKSVFRSPLSIAAGLEYEVDRNAYALSLQYYGSQSLYQILKAEEHAFFRPPDLFENIGGSDEFLRVIGAAVSVLNVAIAYEYKYSPNIHFNTGLRTDMSYYDRKIADIRGINTDITTWDIYHLVAGATLFRDRNSMSVGLVLSMGGSHEYQENKNLSGLADDNILLGSTTISKAAYFSPGLLIGYTFLFKKF